jgi:hypothetical protein
MLGKTGFIGDVRTRGNIVLVFEAFHGFVAQLQTLLKVHPVRKSNLTYQILTLY